MCVSLKNRYTIWKEVQAFLASKLVDWDHLFEILCRANDACLDFNLGDITIQFVRGFGVWSEDRNAIQLSVLLQKDNDEESVTYEYGIEELKSLGKKKIVDSRKFWR